MTSFILIHNSWPNHFLVQWLASRWELNWYDSIRFKWNGCDLSRRGCDSNWYDSKFQFFALNFSTSKLFSRPEFLKILSPPGFSIIIATCHDTLLLEKHDVFLMGSKRLKLPCLITCEIMPLMVLGGYWWFLVGSYRCCHYNSVGLILIEIQYNYWDCQGRYCNHCVPVYQW